LAYIKAKPAEAQADRKAVGVSDKEALETAEGCLQHPAEEMPKTYAKARTPRPFLSAAK